MKNKESGSTLILSMIVIAVLCVCVAAALDYTSETFKITQQSNGRAQAIAAANGALETAFVQWRAACKAYENLTLTSGTISPWISAPTYSDLTGSHALTGSFMNLSGTQGNVGITINSLNAVNPASINNPLSSTATPIPSQAQSLTMPSYNYLAKATVNYQTLNGTNTIRVARVFQKVTKSPWLYSIFYNDDLEINPGATFTINGWVQTNGSLYTGGGGGGSNNLVFANTVTYANSWDPDGAWAPSDSVHGGNAGSPSWVTEPSAGPQQLPQNSTLLTPASTNPNLSDGYREIIEAPNTSYTDPLASTDPNAPSERYYYQAGVKILVGTGATKSATTLKIMKLDGTVLSSTSSIYTTVAGALTTNASLQDGREGTTVTLTQVDISKITTAINSGALNGVSNSNIIYISDTTANQNGPANRGIELVNGYNMPTGGLTVVSDNPVYIQGDYNTASTASQVSTVRSNLSPSNPIYPTANGYTRQPCAVMSDAVTILSNSWNNSNTNSMPTASSTTINAAILSGIVTSARSGSGQTFTYTGGAENYLRLLEDWSGKTLTSYGSMVELFNSKQATGVWRTTGNYYNAPTRQWYFDTNFYANPPPGTFTLISYVKSRWFLM